MQMARHRRPDTHGNKVFRSLTELVCDMGVSRPTVVKAVAEQEAARVIRVGREPSKRNHYYLRQMGEWD